LVNRKKRLKKGIESLDKQIKLHEVKKEEAVKKGNLVLVEYYDKEIENKEKDKLEKERLLKKGG